ncbi:MAG: sugar dehydrogenase, partial [Hydrogenophilales bacterium 17-61-9]
MENANQPLALIIGGSSGMGFATAKLLLEHGINTVIAGNASKKLETAKRELSAFGNIEALQADLY